MFNHSDVEICVHCKSATDAPLAGFRIEHRRAARNDRRRSPSNIYGTPSAQFGIGLVAGNGYWPCDWENRRRRRRRPTTALRATSIRIRKRRTPHRKKKPLRGSRSAAPPPVPPTPEQMPPTPPQVTLPDGMLTIDAKNSTLSQVLRSVQAQTGASVEMPSSAASERVMMQLGPGRPRDVLNTLLNGSKFNYIILGMADDPGGVQKVILTTRQNAAAAVNTAQNNTPAQPQYQPPPDEPQDEEMPLAEVEPDNPPQSPPVSDAGAVPAGAGSHARPGCDSESTAGQWQPAERRQDSGTVAAGAAKYATTTAAVSAAAESCQHRAAPQ